MATLVCPSPADAVARALRPRRSLPALLLLGIVLVAGRGFAADAAAWGAWIRNATDKEARQKLVGETDPSIADAIEAGLRDASLPRTTRVALGAVLVARHEVPRLEKAATDASLDVRTVAFESLARERFFGKQYREDPRFAFHDIVLAWLSDASRSDRVTALNVLPMLYAYDARLPDDVRDALRALASSATKDGTLRYSAAMSLSGYKDCGHASAIADLALAEEEPIAKLRLMQVVVQFLDTGGEACRQAVSEDRARAVVARGLAHKGGDDDANRAVRLGALGILTHHPEWAKALAEPIRGVLDSNAHEVERRTALEAIVASGDPVSIALVPAYLHDASGGVRSSAAGIVRADKPDGRLGLSQAGLNSLLVGYLSNETDTKSYEASLRLTFVEIRRRAGVWVGLPEPYRSKGSAVSPDVADMLHKLLSTGSFEGVTRAQVAEAQFRWLAEAQNLSAADVDAAWKAHGDFWTKARAGDVAGAKTVYDVVSPQKPDLWAYEKGRLLAKRAR